MSNGVRVKNVIMALTVLGVVLMTLMSAFGPLNSAVVVSRANNHPSIPSWTGDHTRSRDIPDTYTYNRQAAYGYAKKWWDGRNPHYNDFSSMGGDCADFVSQCLIAGGLSLHQGTNGQGYGVYPDRDRTISSYGTIPYCDYLNTNLVEYQGAEVTYVTNDNPYVPSNIRVGDVVIFGDKNGDQYKHAMLVISEGDNDCGLAAHSSDKWDESFTNEMNYFSCATFYHIPVNTAEYKHFKVTTSTLNVRVGPGKNEQGNYYQDIGDIHSGEEYIAFGSVTDSNGQKWWHFWYDERAAWCAAAYTTEVTDDAVIQVSASAYLNVRNGPSTSNTIIGQVMNSARFVAYEKSGDWYHYYFSGGSGYSHSAYTTLIEGSVDSGSTSPPVQQGNVDGIDVSHWQGTVDWQKVHNDGYEFAFVKATESTNYVDSQFTTNMQNGRSAGLLMGAYHFARPSSNSAVAEAQHFSSTISPYLGSGYLRPVLDLEDGSSLGKTALSQWVHDFMDEVQRQTGVEPIIYVNSNYARNYLDTSINKYPLWIAQYTSASSPSTGIWSSWDFWQYTDSGTVNGISGHNVDVDRFNGDISRLMQFQATGGSAPPVNQAPTMNAGADRTIKVGTTVNFDASDSYDVDGTITQYTWSFGDGTTAQGMTVSHTYNTPGTYTVTLTGTDNDNAQGTDSCVIQVNANKAPTANAGPDKTIVSGETVDFNGAGSSDSDGSISDYSWSFGDGTTGTGVSTSHTYNTPGTYTVTLTVTDNDGATGSDTCVITVQAQSPSTNAPIAHAGPDQSVTTGDTVHFDGSSSTDSDGNIVSYAWDFGDGTSGTGATADHTYSQAGTYIVKLTVTDNDGNTNSDTAKVTVQNSVNNTPGFEAIGMLVGLLSAVAIAVTMMKRKEED